MITTYFRSGGRLIKVEISTNDVCAAQAETRMIATQDGVSIESPIMAVVDVNEVSYRHESIDQ